MKCLLVCLLFVIVYTQLGCRKILDIEPVTEFEARTIYADDQMATAAVVGLYNRFTANFSPFNGDISRYLGLYSRELRRIGKSETDSLFYYHLLLPDNDEVAMFWNTGFSYMLHCSSILANLAESGKIAAPLRSQLEGETKFIRALVNFYLVNLFDSIPLIVLTDPRENKKLYKTAPAVLYQQMIKDLTDAKMLLSDEYPVNLIIPSPRTRVNRAAASALLARVYLFNQEYAKAVEESGWVINNGLYSLEGDLNRVFFNDSKETILALYPSVPGYNTAEGKLFGINPKTFKVSYELSPTLVSSFDKSDLRFAKWIGTASISGKKYPYPTKYKVVESPAITEYCVLLRLAEMYLVRAEAKAATGDLSGAVADINVIRKRAKAPELLPILTSRQFADSLEMEKHREFFTELGSHWLDIRRWRSVKTNTPNKCRVDDIMEIANPQHWAAYKKNFPIPGDELLKSNLTQNPGYK